MGLLQELGARGLGLGRELGLGLGHEVRVLRLGVLQGNEEDEQLVHVVDRGAVVVLVAVQVVLVFVCQLAAGRPTKKEEGRGGARQQARARQRRYTPGMYRTGGRKMRVC